MIWGMGFGEAICLNLTGCETGNMTTYREGQEERLAKRSETVVEASSTSESESESG